MNKVPSGFKSSEFYLSSIGTLVGIAVMLGYVPADQATHLEEQMRVFIEALQVAFGALITLVSTIAYIYSRLKIKQKAMESGTDTEQVPTHEAEQVQPSTATTSPSQSSYIVQ